MEKKQIDEILKKYGNLEFVQRIANPGAYPRLDMGDGYEASHLMSWAKVGNKSIVYPLIIHDPETGTMTRLSGDVAVQHALQSGEHIAFDSSGDAATFSQQYKKVWDKPKQQTVRQSKSRTRKVQSK